MEALGYPPEEEVKLTALDSRDYLRVLALIA